MAKILLFALYVMMTFFFVAVYAQSKYDRNKNRANEMDISSLGKEFKSRQVIQVWQKAHRMGLSRDKLKDLHSELVRLDGMYFKAKKDSTKPDSPNDIQRRENIEMLVDKQLKEAMKKYGMAGGPMKDEKMKMDGRMKSPVSGDMPFTDRKITQLWLKASKSKMFSDQELEELKGELSKHQEKQNDFNRLMEEVHGPDGSKTNSVKRFDNKNPEEVRDIRTKELELKLKHRELSREFQQMSVKTIPESERGPFSDNRVITLWKEAKTQEFSEEDLQLIMEELQTFESKIMEHEEAHKESLQNDLTFRAPKEGTPDKNRALKDRSLYERAKELGKGINDKMKALRHKISQGGSWAEEL